MALSCIEGIEIFNSEDVNHFCIDDRVSVVENVCLFSEIYSLSISCYTSLFSFCRNFYLTNQLCSSFCIKQSINQSTLLTLLTLSFLSKFLIHVCVIFSYIRLIGYVNLINEYISRSVTNQMHWGLKV